MGTSRSLLDITVEDLCRMIDQVVGDLPDTKGARETFCLMILNPAQARRVIAANPDLAVLNVLFDLVECSLHAQAAVQVH